MKNKKLRREDNRLIGGVCSGISEKYNIPIWIARLLFLFACWGLIGLPILIYSILWVTIPSRNQDKRTERQRKYLVQSIGLVVGAIIGGYVGFSSSSGHGASGEYEKVIFMVLGIPIGAIIGFYIGKKISVKEKIISIKL